MKFVKNCPWGECRKLLYLCIVAGISQMGKPPKILDWKREFPFSFRLRNFTVEHNQTQQFLPKGTASPTRIERTSRESMRVKNGPGKAIVKFHSFPHLNTVYNFNTEIFLSPRRSACRDYVKIQQINIYLKLDITTLFLKFVYGNEFL